MSKTGKIRALPHERLESPISDIRLLSLLPYESLSPYGSGDLYSELHLLSCNLKTYQLNSCPPYIALSYEWGEVEPQVKIMVNGLCFPIRHNLWLFLSALMERQGQGQMQRHGVFAKDLRLWIDAICIDQEDLSERNAQVSIMGDIYRKATSVVAWLGWPQGWDPKIVFQFITLDSWDSWEFLARDDSRKSWGLTYGELLRMVLRMCTCRYWSRRWIVQEILLARNITIMCGENDMSWQRLHSFILRLVAVGLPQELPTKKALEATLPFTMSDYKYGGLGGRKYALTIRQLLAKFRETDCEVLHDRVYSLLSLASDGNNLSVDYGCSPQQLLWRVIAPNGWFEIGDLQLLAEDLGISHLLPDKFRNYEAPKYSDQITTSSLDEKFVITHRVLFCTLPLGREESNVQNWTGPIEPGQELTKLYEILRDSKRHDVYVLGQGSSETEDQGFHNLGNDHQETEGKDQDFYNLEDDGRAGGSRLLTCDDGSIGLACSAARAGDLLCDFIPGRKLVVREDHENILRLVGSAVLPKALPKIDTLLLQTEKLSELAFEEERYNNFLQLDWSSHNGSTVADILLDADKNLFSNIAQGISGLVSTLEAERRTLIRHVHGIDGSFAKRIMKVSCNAWDLIALARQQTRLISIHEPPCT